MPVLRAPVVLAGLLAVLSWHTASNLGGVPAAVSYAALVVLAAVVLVPRAADRLGHGPPWLLPALVGVCLAALAAAFVLGVPAAYHEAMGVGSDRADALDVALTRLAGGQYPYAATTYLGNPITPLPGALVLAAPFWWVTGSAAVQNLAWTVVLLGVVTGGWRPRPAPAVLWVLAAVGGLEVLREFLVGDDLVTGAVPALAAVVATLWAARDRSVAALAVAAAVLGVTTCTRPHLALLVVIVAVAVAVRAGPARAAVVGGCAALAWAALVVPFVLGGAARFSPLHVAAKVTAQRGLSVAIVVVALAALVVLVVALAVVRPVTDARVAWFATAVLFAPSVLSLARGLTVGPVREIDLTLGAAAVPFAVWASTTGGPSVSRFLRLARDPGQDQVT